MKTYRVVGILLLLVAVLYLPFLGNAFVSDDIAGLVYAAPAWTWLSSVGWPNYIHLSILFQYGLYHVFGMTPWPFRLLNILFHAGNVILVYLIAKKLVHKTIAIVAALLFAVHPLATEAVIWISGGTYSQHTFFLLAALWLYMKRTEKAYIGAIVLFILCLFTSEKTIVLSLIFISFEWFYGNLRKNWKHTVPFVALSLICTVFYGLKIGDRTASVTALSYQSPSGLFYPFVQLPIAISSYGELFLWPSHLTLYHFSFIFPWWNLSIRAAVTVIYVAFLVYTLVRRKPIGFWLLWFLIGLLPMLTPLKIAWVVAERYVYFSLIGLCILIAMVFNRVISSKKWKVVLTCVGIIVVIALCTRTLVRNSEWSSQDTLWVATLRESPEDPQSWNNMGDVYARHGEFDKSIEAFTQATKLNPNYADAYHNIGNTYLQMKKYDEAVPFFEKAVSINPNLWQSYQDLAVIAAEKKEYQQALSYIDQALKINPTDPTLLQNVQVLRRATIHP
jgi:hypothetical protein